MGWTARLDQYLHEYFHDYYFGYIRRRRLKVGLAIGGGVLVLLIAGLIVYVSSDNGSSEPSSASPTTVAQLPESTTTAEPASVTSAEATLAGSQPAVVVDSTTPNEPTTTPSPPTTTTTTGTASSTSTPPSNEDQESTFSTLPNGEPTPLIAVFDTDTITLSGAAPSRSALDRLVFLVAARRGSPAEIVNDVEINPDVPIGVGVRLVDVDPVAFGDDSSTIASAYFPVLDEAASLMRTLPRLTLTVVGHAGPAGAATSDFGLASDRAQAIVNYLAFVGVDPGRLAARAAGATDILASPESDSPAVNARVELLMYGLLISD